MASAFYGWADCTVTILSLGYIRPNWRMKYAVRDVKRKFDQQRLFIKEAVNKLKENAND